MLRQTNACDTSGPLCHRCGAAVEIVADIPPRRNDPGLRAFVCDGCGRMDSILVYPTGPLSNAARQDVVRV